MLCLAAREGNGNPLQCSCLENPRDGEAWWAAVYGVAQSRTRLKQLSSASQHLPSHFPNQGSNQHSLPWKRSLNHWTIRSDQIRSVSQSCPTLCDPKNHSTPGLPVHHQLLEFTETHVHQVSDAIQPSYPLSSPSPLAPNPSQHQSLFQ